jgi:HTH-type transcriptional regulator/antitoxin HigA
MRSGTQNQYYPDVVSPPGETLLEAIEERGISQADLAQRMGRPKKTINEIIQGKTAITPDTALQLDRVLGIPARFWNNLEQQYRHFLIQQEEKNRLSNQVEWLQNFPLREMINRGWIQAFDDDVQQLRELLSFFGVASLDAWETVWGQVQVAFRKTPAFESDRYALFAWLRQGEVEALDIKCQSYSEKVFRETLVEIRRLTVEPPQIFQPELVRLCAEAGVAVAFIPQLPKARVSGATRWLSSDKALIQLSLRYKTDDHLWFSFFHEAGHIVRHGKRQVFLEGDNMNNVEEQEANDFASKILIPPTELKNFLKKLRPGYYPSKQAIQVFAHKLGIAPGIVVGRLQHDEYLPYSHCNDLKQTFRWATN